jgi:phospholipid/cholesterol/gamma-HCH transport system substrate-binding protein
MNEQAMRFRVGVFVLATLMLLAVLITLFGGFPNLFRRHDHYTVIFNDAPGVTKGTPVRRSGVRIGEVQRVDLDDATGKVRVAILVEKPHPLYKTDQPTLVHGLLSGDTSIDFVPPRPNGQPAELTPVAADSELAGISHNDVATLVNQAADLAPAAQDALNQIRNSLQRFEKMAPLMEDALREYRDLGRAARETVPAVRRTNDELQTAARNWGDLGERANLLLRTNQDQVQRAADDLAVIIKNVRAGSGSFESLARNTDELVKDSRQTLRRFNESMTRADQVLTNLQQGTKPLAERGESVMKNLDESLINLNKSLVETRELLRAANQGDGSFRKFLDDPMLYNSLSEAACGINRLLPKMDRILENVEVFADKIARHPESLGLGGMVRPSSGLKTAPASGHWPQGQGP